MGAHLFGDAASKNVGTASGTVAAGDDARFNRYRQVYRGMCRAVASAITGAGDYTAGGSGAFQAPATVGQPAITVYLDPANGATIRMAAACAVNDTAPGRIYILGLYPVGTPSGATANVFNPNLGAVITASKITFATQAANSKSAETVTADFACPAAGWYCFGLNSDGTAIALSVAHIMFRLEQKD